MGNVTQQSLREIWQGTSAGRLRDAMERHDLSLGCSYCEWAVDSGAPHLAFAREFDGLDFERPVSRWPKAWHLALSNACNLQCVMCSGELSSSIRAHRERLPPLPPVYDDRFFADLAEALPEAERLEFTGGEPFLSAPTIRVWKLIDSLDLHPRVSVVTNGTQWSDRVERWVRHLRMDVKISLDGISPAVLEAIRVGVDADALLRNVDRFHEACRAVGSELRLAFCLMVGNWHEFADVLAFADERGIGVDVNVVASPAAQSLLWLGHAELAEVIGAMEATDRGAVGADGPNAGVWAAELDRLRSHLAALSDRVVPPESDDGLADLFSDLGTGDPDDERSADELRSELRSWAGRGVDPVRVTADVAGRVLAVDGDPSLAFGVDLGDLDRGTVADAYGKLVDVFGLPAVPVFRRKGPSRSDYTNRFGGADGVALRMVVSARRDHGRVVEVELLGISRAGSGSEVQMP